MAGVPAILSGDVNTSYAMGAGAAPLWAVVMPRGGLPAAGSLPTVVGLPAVVGLPTVVGLPAAAGGHVPEPHA